jgi:predicted nucleic-acid-binding Zn-ribbon protein
MTKTLRYILSVCAVIGCIVWVSCKQERQVCLTPKIAILNLKTVHYADSAATTVSDSGLPAAIFAALTATGTQGLLYNKQATFTISLSPLGETCQWIFTADTSTHVFDTITLYYERDLEFISNACGYTYFYNIDSVFTTHKIIDSIQVNNTSVTNNVNTQHLQVFIHPNY